MKKPMHIGTVTAFDGEAISLFRLDDGSYVIRNGAKGTGKVIHRGDAANAAGFTFGWLDPVSADAL